MEEEFEDPLAEFDDIKRDYDLIKEYLSKPNKKGIPRINKETPFPVVTVWINKCIKRFTKTQYSKPKEKVVNLCLRYLDEIGYKIN